MNFLRYYVKLMQGRKLRTFNKRDQRTGGELHYEDALLLRIKSFDDLDGYRTFASIRLCKNKRYVHGVSNTL